MLRKPVIIWLILSVAIWVAGAVWRNFTPDNEGALYLKFCGWVSFLLALGYYSTPSNSIYGKISFGCVILMVTGIVWKILHLPGANVIIIISLLGIAGTYAIMLFGKKVPQ